MAFENRYIEIAKNNKYKIIDEMAHFINSLGLNYALKIKVFVSYLVFFRGKIEKAKDIIKRSGIKIEFDFDIITECLDVIIKKTGFKFEESTEKLFLASYNSYYVKKREVITGIDSKKKEIKELYNSLKIMTSYYYDVCLRISLSLETDKDLYYIMSYVDILCDKIKEYVKEQKDKYQKYVGVNLKKFRGGNNGN